jgi:hypothetical protein
LHSNGDPGHREHGILAGREHLIQASQDGHGQHLLLFIELHMLALQSKGSVNDRRNWQDFKGIDLFDAAAVAANPTQLRTLTASWQRETSHAELQTDITAALAEGRRTLRAEAGAIF